MSADWLPLLHEIADLADSISQKYFRSVDLRIDSKPDKSLVTEADLEVEARVRDLVAKRSPELAVYGEEHGKDDSDAKTWLIIDPIDGTANFARGLPIWATLLGIEHEGEVVAGLVSAPALHHRWHAARGQGAFLGERKLQVSAVRELSDAQVFHGSLAGLETTPATERLHDLISNSWRQRGVGDFWQHMLVAEGCGEIAVDVIVAPWDIAALQVIVDEAGGKATSLRGERSIYRGSLISSNGLLHERALQAFEGL
jgi:histidinol-phosphatase